MTAHEYAQEQIRGVVNKIADHAAATFRAATEGLRDELAATLEGVASGVPWATFAHGDPARTAEVTWQPFDYANKAATAPPVDKPVWIINEYDRGAVPIGYFDGFTMRPLIGYPDMDVSWWAEIVYPAPPERG